MKRRSFATFITTFLRQAKAGERIDTETELATRFNVTRYKVRKALSVLSQMASSTVRPSVA